MGLSTTLALIGLGLSAFLYLRTTDLPVKIGKAFKGLYTLLYNKYYIDELYDFIIIRPTMWIARGILVGITDAKMIEGIVNGVPRAIGQFSQSLRRIQTGLVEHYGIFMAAGAVFIIALVWLLR